MPRQERTHEAIHALRRFAADCSTLPRVQANGYANTGDNTLQATSDDGSIIILEDGSVWEVAPADQATVSTWTDSDNIVVQDDGPPDYTIVDTDDGMGGPAPGFCGAVEVWVVPWTCHILATSAVADRSQRQPGNEKPCFQGFVESG